MKMTKEQRKLGQLKGAKQRAWNNEVLKNGTRSIRAQKLQEVIWEIDYTLKTIRGGK